MGYLHQRRYSRVRTEQAARVAVRGWYWDQTRATDAVIYELGPAGCGIFVTDREIELEQGVYLEIPSDEDGALLNLCARIVWKKPELGGCRYGLEFLWMKVAGSDSRHEPVIRKLNQLLRPTGHALLLSAA